MGKAKYKITVKQSKVGESGSPLAKARVVVEKKDSKDGKKLYETKAELITHIRRGTRPKTSRPRRSR